MNERINKQTNRSVDQSIKYPNNGKKKCLNIFRNSRENKNENGRYYFNMSIFSVIASKNKRDGTF